MSPGNMWGSVKPRCRPRCRSKRAGRGCGSQGQGRKGQVAVAGRRGRSRWQVAVAGRGGGVMLLWCSDSQYLLILIRVFARSL